MTLTDYTATPVVTFAAHHRCRFHPNIDLLQERAKRLNMPLPISEMAKRTRGATADEDAAAEGSLGVFGGISPPQRG